jgi:anionic cell wall polymer biosynthesis LytR-Cps2A-Psr (LCP) family protein
VIVEIPGFGGGPEVLGRALTLGQEPTLISAASNLLGVQFDHHLRISDQGIRALFDKVGGLTIEVDQKLTRRDPDGKVRVVFAEGRQHLDGGRVSEYLTFLDEGGDEISRAVRHASIWSALLEEYRSKGVPELNKLLVESKDLFSLDAEVEALAKFLEPFVSESADSVQFETLPVQAQAVQSGSQLYGPDAEAIDRMVERYLAGSRPGGEGRSGKRMQILNGNGTPGIGEEVAGKLLPKGFQLVLDANAIRFDYEKTQIVIYSDSKKAQAMADEIRQALGVGEILISRQKQSIVDVTIVVGKDYLSQR